MSSSGPEVDGRTYVGAYALCLDQTDRILLCRLSRACHEAGYWTLPGGGIAWGESPEEAVQRELAEETGLQTLGTPVVSSIFSTVYPGVDSPAEGRLSPLHYLAIVFDIREVAGDLRPEEDGSTDLCAWFTQEEAEELPLVALAQHALGVVRGSSHQ